MAKATAKTTSRPAVTAQLVAAQAAKPKATKLTNALRMAIVDHAWKVIDNPDMARVEAVALKRATKVVEAYVHSLYPATDRRILGRHGVLFEPCREIRICRHAKIDDGDTRLCCWPVTSWSPAAMSGSRGTGNWHARLRNPSLVSCNEFHWPNGYAYRLLHLTPSKPILVPGVRRDQPHFELSEWQRPIKDDNGHITGVALTWRRDTLGCGPTLAVPDAVHDALMALQLATARYMANKLALVSVVVRITGAAKTFEQIEEQWPELSRSRSEVLTAGGVGDAVHLPAISYGVTEQELEALRFNSEQRKAA